MILPAADQIKQNRHHRVGPQPLTLTTFDLVVSIV